METQKAVWVTGRRATIWMPFHHTDLFQFINCDACGLKVMRIAMMPPVQMTVIDEMEAAMDR
jgi:hypothetical protein